MKSAHARRTSSSGARIDHAAIPQSAYEFGFGFRPNNRQLLKASYKRVGFPRRTKNGPMYSQFNLLPPLPHCPALFAEPVVPAENFSSCSHPQERAKLRLRSSRLVG